MLAIYADYLFETQRVEEAEQFYHLALQVEPKHPHLMNNFGVFLCIQTQDFEQSISVLRAANAVAPDSRLILHNLIQVLTVSGRGEATEITSLEKELSLRKSQVQSPK